MLSRLTRAAQKRAEQRVPPTRLIEILTIVFELDVRLCQLQLTSIDRHFDLAGVSRFTIIVNGGVPVLEEIRSHARTLSNELRNKLVLIEPSEIRKGNFNSWRGQQILKMLFARRVETSHYLILDAKNHLIRAASVDDWFDAEGRARTHLSPVSDPMRRLLKASYDVFGLDRDTTIPSMPTVTPYLMNTAEAKAMMRDVGRLAEVPFVRAFNRKYRNVGEFFLYYAYLVHKYGSIDRLYYNDVRNCVSLFTRWPEDPRKVQSMLEKLDDPAIHFFGLHRNRLVQLDASQKERINQVWQDAGILTVHDADYYLTPLA